MHNTRTGIIIVDYNNASDTINCVNSVLKYSDHTLIQIAIVDNGSSIENIITMKKFIEQLEVSSSYFDLADDYSSEENSIINYIETHRNLGYAQGNNVGLNFFSRKDEIEYILILNNDILLFEPIINPLVNVLNSESSCGIVSPILFKADGSLDYNCARKEPSLFDIIIEQSFLLHKIPLFSNIQKNRYLIRNKSLKSELMKIEMPSGSCFLIRKDLFLSIGGLDPSTFLYYEENILYRKLIQSGLESVLLTTSSCIHLGGSSTKKEASLFLVKCSQSSLLYYLTKYRNKPRLLIFYLKTLFKIKNFLLSVKNNLKK